MEVPNLFKHATSELSQDAFLCWLVEWANPELKEMNEALHLTGCAFLDALLEAGRVAKPVNGYTKVQIKRQSDRVDALVVVNDATAILIEDKTDTSEHNDQLSSYRAVVEGEYGSGNVACIYFKTGNQGDLRGVTRAGFAHFKRGKFLEVLNAGESRGVRNDIFIDYLRRLRELEVSVQAFQTIPCDDPWSDRQWEGFFLVVQDELGGAWKKVPSPSGSFPAFAWHEVGNRYLQLERAELCFKLRVNAEADRAPERDSWSKAVLSQSGFNGLTLAAPRRRLGKWMTVARLKDDYRVQTATGTIDLPSTINKLRDAEALMDAAVRARGDVPGVSGG